ncbi:MAG: preprotein translocase subunit YajC [Firmicutes bacterium]|nr:preprotein translocase subunit YajC [Bacillota bacterium]
MGDQVRLLAPMAIFFVAMYFLVIRPQTTQQKKRKAMLSELKEGSKIRTIGGIYGTVEKIRDDELTVRVADNIRIRMARFSVESIINE